MAVAVVVVGAAVVAFAAVPETRNNTKRGGGRWGVEGKEQVVVVRGVHGVSWAATITKTRRENITSHII